LATLEVAVATMVHRPPHRNLFPLVPALAVPGLKN